MSIVDFTLFKKHVRADDFEDDDTYLSHLLKAAEAHVIASTNRRLEELRTMGENGNIPIQLVHAICVLGAHWYNQRENVAGVQMAEVPYTISALVKPFTKLA